MDGESAVDVSFVAKPTVDVTMIEDEPRPWAETAARGYRSKMGIEHAMTLMMRSRTLVAISRRAMQLAAISQSGGLWEVRQRFATDS